MAGSPNLSERAKAERELERLEEAKPAAKAAQIIPRLADEYRAWVGWTILRTYCPLTAFTAA